MGDTREAFKEGCQAFRNARDEDDNPYVPNTREYTAWADGYQRAMDEQEDAADDFPD